MTFTEKIENVLPEIDVNTGLMYCGDDEELYEEVVGEFVEGEMTVSIEENFKNKNWKDYQIEVHAVKGTISSFETCTVIFFVLSALFVTLPCNALSIR